ncbi:MAG TPA: NHLP family bacteriocin export ABC transporter peptidase/permease/ATPase subunit [Xanthomonadaceae bacterium]|nr:NHLP family bacteriocin export ABC transporter peptidase/permease/ATPase subunit [Xanthomonadaceae bacterium]
MESISTWPLIGRLCSKRVRTPTILQLEALECGAAALGIILAYYDRWVPLTELRRACGVSRDGSQASYILQAARNYGMQAKAYAIGLNEIKNIPCPYIIFWNFNHFLVVEGVEEERDRVFLNDPASGPRSVTFREFSESYTEIVLYLEPGEEFEKAGHKPSTIPALWRRLRASLSTVGFCVLLGLLLVLPGLAVPVFSQVFVDNILVRGMHDWLRPLVLGMMLTALLRGGLDLWRLKFLRVLRIKLAVVMSSQFMWLLLRLPVSFYAQRYAGEISSRMEINDEVASLLSGRLATTVIDLFMIVFYAIVMYCYDMVLASIGVVGAVINLLALRWVARSRVDTNSRLQQEYGKTQGLAIAGLQGIETLKASGLESDFFARWAGTFAKVVNTQQQLTLTNQSFGVLPSFLTAMTTAMVLIVGGLRVMSGHFSIGMLVAFQSLMASFLQPMDSLLGLGGSIQELQGGLNRLDDVLLEKEDPSARDSDEVATDGRVRLEGRVELRNLTFGYNRVSPPLIEDLSLVLEPGRRVAFVGPSGSGKSTIAKLVCGLYEPWSGEVLFDRKPRSEIPRAVLATSIALVEQDIFLFEGSVRDNLTLWCSFISDSEMMQACRDACIHTDINGLPGGYDAQLEEGARNLSGGQRQRLDIARALVNNPSVLVLDEATSALDAETEQLIDRHLRQRGCSCVIVAHRLSTIRDCDEIIVLRAGKVVERGTHDALLAMNGAYAELISVEGDALLERFSA